MDPMSMFARRVAIGTALLLGLAACQPATGSVPPAASGSAAAASSAPPAGSSLPVAASSSVQAGQTETAWGRIWDSLPTGFPTYPGSTPAEEAATGAVSAVLAIQGVDAKTITGWIQSKLELASYSTEALSGPLEDGSFVLDSTGPAPGCRVQVSIAPLGGLTTITVLYGAGCPKP
jgi:hypothetical protein